MDFVFFFSFVLFDTVSVCSITIACIWTVITGMEWECEKKKRERIEANYEIANRKLQNAYTKKKFS